MASNWPDPQGSYVPYPATGTFEPLDPVTTSVDATGTLDPYGTDAFGGQAPYGMDQYGADAYATGEYATGQYATAGYATGEYAVDGYGTGQYADDGYGAGAYGTAGDPGTGFGFTAAPAADPDSGASPEAGTAAPVTDEAPADAGAFAAYGPPDADFAGSPLADADGDGEWNPTEDSLAPSRGRHRVGRQRSGGMVRSGAVLGVGMIAAVGAGGMATAKDQGGRTSVSMPDIDLAAADAAEKLPGVGDLVGDDTQPADAGTGVLAAGGHSDAGEALRARILDQADRQKSDAAASAREAAVSQAAADAQAEAAKKAADEAQAEAARKRAQEEKERLAKLARSFKLPVGNVPLGPGFGQAGNMWSSDHTGQDFTASTGTPIKAVHTGTIKEAGWDGPYGYRTVLQLDDGTELWFCHQSSISVSVGQKVNTGDVIGRVGATGNVTGPHLHLEVRPGGGDPVDPLPWLRAKGLKV